MIERDNGMDSCGIDYSAYRMTAREWVFCSMKAGVVISAVCHIFFRNDWFSAAAFILGVSYPRFKVRKVIARRRHELLLQFKDLLQSLSSSVLAGKPLEAAFKESCRDLDVIYQEPDIPIVKEVQTILRKIGANQTIESAFGDFAERSGLEDVRNFHYTISACKRAGGDIAGIISNTAAMIGDKIDMSYECDVILAQRKMEQKILICLPVVMVALLSYSAGGYMYPVFSTVAGRLAMCFALMLFGTGYLVSKKIMDIRL